MIRECSLFCASTDESLKHGLHMLTAVDAPLSTYIVPIVTCTCACIISEVFNHRARLKDNECLRCVFLLDYLITFT